MRPNPNLIAAGSLAAKIHARVGRMIKPGLNLLSIDRTIAELIAKGGMKAAFKGYKGYPAVSCLSVNSVVVHGIPKDYRLRVGDVISVDLGISNNGWIVDTAVTHPVGVVSLKVKKLLTSTKQALDEAIKLVHPGGHVGDLSAKIQEVVETAGFFIVKELTGHGIGKELQMPPTIPNFGHPGQGPEIKEGMILAIEPITALEKVRVELDNDDWTIRAQPDVTSVHFEHTVFVGPTGPFILTSQP